MRTLLTLLLLTTASCQWMPFGTDTASDDSLRVQVKQAFAAGKQCSDEPFEVPVAEDILRKAGIRTYGGYEIPMAVCLACEVCPAYAAEQVVTIASADTTKAKGLGFTVMGPSSD